MLCNEHFLYHEVLQSVAMVALSTPRSFGPAREYYGPKVNRVECLPLEDKNEGGIAPREPLGNVRWSESGDQMTQSFVSLSRLRRHAKCSR